MPAVIRTRLCRIMPALVFSAAVALGGSAVVCPGIAGAVPCGPNDPGPPTGGPAQDTDDEPEGTGASPQIVDTRFDGYAAGRSVAADVVFS
jgi:hypothetical protein